MRRLLLLLVLGSVVNCGAPSGVHEELEQQIRTLAEQAITEEGIVGLSIGVALDGEIVFQEGFGYIDEARTVPATAETGYDAGSIGKQFTADDHFGFEASSWYWHFVDVVWLSLFFAVYIWGFAGAAH